MGGIIMSVGQILSDMFGTVKARFGSLLGLWAIFLGITIGMFMIVGVGMAGVGIAGMAALGDSDPFAAGASFVVFLILFYIAYLLVAMAQYGSLISMASPLDRPTVSAAFNAGWRAAPAMLLLIIVLLIGYFAVALVFSAAGAALSFAGDTAAGLLVLALVPVMIWLGCRLAPLLAVMTVDRVRNPFTAIARSWRLTRGHALTIFLAALVFMVILIVLCGALLLPSFGLLSSLGDTTGDAGVAPALGAMLLFFASMLLLSLLFNLLYCAFMAVVHGALTSAAGEGTAVAFE